MTMHEDNEDDAEARRVSMPLSKRPPSGEATRVVPTSVARVADEYAARRTRQELRGDKPVVVDYVAPVLADAPAHGLAGLDKGCQ